MNNIELISNMAILFHKVKNCQKFYESKIMNIYPIEKGTKDKMILCSKGYQSKYWNLRTEYSDFKKDSNLAFVCGYDEKNIGKHFAVLDVDGYKKDGDEVHEQVCKDILELLESCDIEYIKSKSQSNGYHLWIFSKEEFNTKETKYESDWLFLKHIRFKEDYHIPELRNYCLNYDNNNTMLEIFNHKKLLLVDPSIVKETTKRSDGKHSTRIGTYQILDDDPDLKRIFDNPVENIKEKILQAVSESKTFYFDEDGYKKELDELNHANIKKESKQNNHDDSFENGNADDIVKLSKKTKEKLIHEMKILIKLTSGNHNEVIIALSHGLSRYGLSDEDVYLLFDESLAGESDKNEHMNQVKHSLENPRKDKRAFKSLLEVYANNKRIIKHIRKIQELLDESKKVLIKEQKKRIQNQISEFADVIADSINQSDGDVEIYKTLNKGIEQLFESIGQEDIYHRYEFHAGKGTRSRVAKQIVQDLNIKVKYQNGKEQYRYLNNENPRYYEDLNAIKLKYLLKELKDVNYDDLMSENILKAIAKPDKINDNLIQCSNLVIDTDGIDDYLEDGDINHILLKDFDITSELVDKKFGIKIPDTDKFILLEFDENAVIHEDGDPDETIVEKRLKEVLIPKDDPKNTSIFIDRLQRFGARFLNQKDKSITFSYDGKGNAGKSLILHVMKLILNDLCVVIDGEDLDDQFVESTIANKHLIAIDEITNESIHKIYEKLKKLRTPEFSKNKRIIFKGESTEYSNFGAIEIFCNNLINPDDVDNAFINSLDLIEYLNEFVKVKDESQLKSNQYMEDVAVFKKLKEDVDGLSWLLSISILEFLKMKRKNQTFVYHQSRQETFNLLNNLDPYIMFLSRYTELADNSDEFAFNVELVAKFNEFLKLYDYNIKDSDQKKAIEMGKKVTTVHGNAGKGFKDTYKGKANNTRYPIRLKSFDELEKELHMQIQINEDDYHENLQTINTLHGNTRTIYNQIEKGATTIFKLNKEFQLIDVYEEVKKLEEMNLIIKSSNMILDE